MWSLHLMSQNTKMYKSSASAIVSRRGAFFIYYISLAEYIFCISPICAYALRYILYIIVNMALWQDL